MKFSTLAFLALAAPATALVTPIFEGAPEEVIRESHEWCCTDAGCSDSCALTGLEPGEGIVEPECNFADPCDPNTSALPCCTAEFFNGYTYLETFLNLDGAAEQFCSMFFKSVYECGQCKPAAAGCADPHFKRWNGEWYDFHGECDLNFIQAPNFAKGLGMDVTIRTKQRHGYSYIETAAMRIGDDVLEVSSWADYKLNGVASADLEGAHLGPFEIKYEYVNEKEQTFNIITDKDQVIQMKTFKDFVDVKLDNIAYEDFVGSVGMLGSYPHGKMTARDGSIIEDTNEYAMEWQVQAADPQLFSVIRAPQHPVQCILPTEKSVESRRLAENGVSHEEATAACDHWDEEHKDMCIFDVVATGDMEMATAGAY